jgi:muramoyltetrapeptide carboxypeptidase
VLRPRGLRPGAIIGVVAPSGCVPARAPHRVARGKAFLESLGFRVVLAPHLFAEHRWTAGRPEERAEDLMAFFTDPAVDGIWAAIGGDHSCQLLPHLDWSRIAGNPKVFIGYSDISVLCVALWTMTGLITFHGPALMDEIAEDPEPPAYAVRQLLRVLTRPEPPGPIEPAPSWTDERLEWTTREDLTRPRTYRPSPGWTWLRPGSAKGVLVGGCLSSLQHLRGTRYFPDLRGAIFFWELSEVRPSPAWVDAVLQDYENMGVLEGLAGMLVGRPYGYTDEERRLLREVVLERTARYRFPVIADMDFGHTAPQMTLPVGCRARIDGERRTSSLIEPTVV